MTETRSRVLVTGATGFLGRYCAARLVERRFEVHALSSRVLGAPNGTGVQWHRIDLLDAGAIGKLIADIQPTHLLHLAWIAVPGQFWTSPANLRWLECGVTLARDFYECGGRRAVGVGTCAEYDWSEGTCDETATALRPSTVYGQCKLAMGLAWAAAADLYGRSAAWARVFFPYGPGEAPDRLVPSVIRGLLRNECVALSEGNQIRDFVFVADVADALITLLESEAAGPFNVGSGTGVAIRDVVGVIADALGGHHHLAFGARPTPPHDPVKVIARVNRIHHLGWSPRTSLHEGLAKAIADWRIRLA